MSKENKIKELNNIKEFNNIKEIIYNSVEEYKNNVAFVVKHKNGYVITYENITYEKLLRDINNFGTSLYKLGLKDKRVAVIGRNRYEWVVAHLSNLLGSIISIPLDKDLQYEELESSLIRSKADCIVFDYKLKENIEKIKEQGKTKLKEYICMEEQEEYKSVGECILQGEKYIQNGEIEYIQNEIDENKLSILLFTSGTTSKSKAVMLSQKNIASNIYQLRCAEDVRDTDSNIAFLPYHHIFGSTCMVMMLASGCRTAFPDGLKYIKQNLSEYQVSIFVGVPLLIEGINRTIVREIKKQGKENLIKIAKIISNTLLKLNVDIRRKIFKSVIDALGGKLRLIVVGGAPADKEVLKNLCSMGIETIQGYGLTETSPVIAAETKIYAKNGSVGKALKGQIVEVVNKDENGIGEIRVKGPNVMLGYYEMPEITNEVLRNGWFYTGDLGYIDKDGYIYITGRSKNLIVLNNGKKVFPEEVETIVSRLEDIEECMVFGMPDESDENDITLSVKVVLTNEVLKEKYENMSEEEIYENIWEQIKEVNKMFPKYKHIKKLIISKEELIKTTTKKIKRNEEMKKILAYNNIKK